MSEVAFTIFVLASLVLLALNGPFFSRVSSRHPELLSALRLDDQGIVVAYARWQSSLLPYSGFILRRKFVRAFQGEADLLKLCEIMFWVHALQVVGFAAFVVGVVISGIGYVAA
jgi:hypothetical protein